MSFEFLTLDRSDGIATITLNRPKKKNAMNPALHRDMTSALDQLRYEPTARVLMITGAGDAFCGFFAAALQMGSPWLSAMHFASVGAGLSCLGLGAQEGMPAYDDIQANLDKLAGAEKIG